ncbi:MAG: hypothetical protein ABJG78_03950 [Cyclobacteriaceae bacterium]
MKAIKAIFLLSSLIFLSNCGSDDSVNTDSIIIPNSFTVDVPSSISSNTGALSGRTNGDGDGFIEGDEIYESLRGFIYVAEESAEIVEFVLDVAEELEKAEVTSFTFTGEEDGREKRISLAQNVTKGGATFQFEMTVFDTENEDQALQLVWSANPIEGIAIINPYHLERTGGANPETFIRISYSENLFGYQEGMQVQIAGLEAEENGDIDNMALFVGRNGEEVDVIGNSNHPNLVIVDEGFIGGRAYAFVGRANETTNIAVVDLALPPSSASSTTDLFEDYSVFSVLEEEIESAGIVDQTTIDAILVEAQSPAYFDATGFVTSGEANKPLDFSAIFVDLTGLTPFVPSEVQNLKISFVQ